MNTMDCIKNMLDASHKSARTVSVEMGKFPTFLATTFYKGTSTRVDTFAKIAGLTGCKVFVRLPDGEEIEVTE